MAKLDDVVGQERGRRSMKYSKNNCYCCLGDEALYWRDEENCAFIDSMGEIEVHVQGKSLSFSVDRCPKCGRLFSARAEDYTQLRSGDDIFYVNFEVGKVETGKVSGIHFRGGSVDVISVDFENGDFEEFDGTVLGNALFSKLENAERILISGDPNEL